MRVNFWSWYMCIYLLLSRSSIIPKFDSRNYLYQRLRLWIFVWSECIASLLCDICICASYDMCLCWTYRHWRVYTSLCLCLFTKYYSLFLIHYFFPCVFFLFVVFVCFNCSFSIQFFWYNADKGNNKSPTQPFEVRRELVFIMLPWETHDSGLCLNGSSIINN